MDLLCLSSDLVEQAPGPGTFDMYFKVFSLSLMAIEIPELLSLDEDGFWYALGDGREFNYRQFSKTNYRLVLENDLALFLPSENEGRIKSVWDMRFFFPS